MPKAKGRKAQQPEAVDPRIRQLRSHVGIGWKISAILAVIGSILMIVGCATKSWVVLEPISFRYQTSIPRKQLLTQTYQESKFGLYLTGFNANSDVLPWSTRVDNVCSGYTQVAAQSATSGLINLWQGSCSTNCVAHFASRCNAYKQMGTLGLVVLAFAIGGACLSLTASLWLFVFGKSVQFFQFAWLGTSLVAGIIGGWFMFAANTQFTQLRVNSHYPDFSFGPSAILLLVGCGFNFVAGVIICVLAYYDSQEEWRIKQEKIMQQEADMGDMMLAPHMGAGQRGQMPGISVMRNAPPPPRFGAPPPPPGLPRR